MMKRVILSHSSKRLNQQQQQQMRRVSTAATIDFTQSPSQFIQQQLKSVESPVVSSVNKTINKQQQLNNKQSIVQIQSLNQHLQTKAESLVSQLNQMIQEAQVEPKKQQEALEKFKRIVYSDEDDASSSSLAAAAAKEEESIMNQITSYQQYLDRFLFVQNTFQQVNEHAANQGFHQAHASLFSNNHNSHNSHNNNNNKTDDDNNTDNTDNNKNSILNLLSPPLSSATTVSAAASSVAASTLATSASSTTSYHHYPLIYTLDMFMTSVINAFELGQYTLAKHQVEQFLSRLKSLNQMIDRAVLAHKRRVALANAEFKSSGRYGKVGSGVESVEADLEDLRKQFYTVPSRWNPQGVSPSEFDPVLGTELPHNVDSVYESVAQYEAQANVTLIEILTLSNEREAAESFLQKRLEDPTLENTLVNALDVAALASLKARMGDYSGAAPLFSRAIKQLLSFPKTQMLRSIYENMLLLCEVRMGKRDSETIGQDILTLADSLLLNASATTKSSSSTKSTSSTPPSEENAQINHYARMVLVELLMSRNNSAQAHKYIDQMIANRGIPHLRITSFDYPYLLKRRAEALAMDGANSEAVEQVYNHAIAIALEQVGANGYKLPLLYDSYANYCEKVTGDVTKANELRSKMNAVLSHNNATLEYLKNAEFFSFVLIGLSLPRAYPLLPTESVAVRQEGIDSLQRLNQLKQIA